MSIFQIFLFLDVFEGREGIIKMECFAVESNDRKQY